MHYVGENELNKVTLIVQTLNENIGLRTIMPQIKEGWCDQIIILDGNSTDGSIEWCENNGYTVFRQKKRGGWDAYKELFQSGLIEGEVVITMSPDGNCLTEAIPVLIKKMNEGYDMVVASRYKALAISYDDTKLSKLANRVFTWLINRLCHLELTDSLGIYRAYKKELASEFGLDREPNWYIRQLMKMTTLVSWEIALSMRCGKMGKRVGEIPSDEPLRIDDDHSPRSLHKRLGHGFSMIGQFCYELVRR
jgi:glycosyltransferase involved in cell wall biosynthesis